MLNELKRDNLDSDNKIKYKKTKKFNKNKKTLVLCLRHKVFCGREFSDRVEMPDFFVSDVEIGEWV